MKRSKKYRFFHLIIMIYLIAAFSWWAILLYRKNQENQKLAIALSAYDQSIDSVALNQEFEKQKKMIIGEGLVFALSILAGLILINRAFRKELELNKNINNFLLSVTHELKTPLATLSLINKTLLNKVLPEGKKKELLATAMEESIRLESLVNNILTAAQMEQHYTFNMERLSLTELVSDRVHRYRKLFTDYDFEIIGNTDIHYSVDRESFVKLLDNLLDNAVKYSPAGSLVTVMLAQKEAYIALNIIDEGSGIIGDEKQRVLQKFYRIGNEETRESKGTGLGLFIANEIVKAHNGKMIISDNQPKGTIIEIRLNTK